MTKGLQLGNAAIDTLYIGTKFVGHDSAIFVALPEAREVFAISCERLTRYKHDDLYPLAAFQSFIHYTGINPRAIKKIHIANSFISQQHEKFASDRYEIAIQGRRFHQAPYLKDYQTKVSDFSKVPVAEQIKIMSQTDDGRALIQLIHRQLTGQVCEEPLQLAMRRHLLRFFPAADIEVAFYDHQLCHAISSLFCTNFERTLLLTFDGYGDGSFSKAILADGVQLKEIASSRYQPMDLKTGRPDYMEGMGSPGGIYHYFTYLLGFQPDADEGKVEALAAYAQPDPKLLADLQSLFTLNRENHGLDFDRGRAESVLNFSRMQGLLKELQREVLAASVQTFLDTLMVEYCSYLMKLTGATSLSLSGGVAANVIANLRIFESVTPNLHIIPAMGDDGTAQGAAYMLLLQKGFSFEELRWLRDQQMPYYGTSYTREAVLARISQRKPEIRIEDCGDRWPEVAADLICDGKIGALFHGRMEWGPRALGNRSIIADARRSDMRELINKEIKRRPLFQPFCPSMLAEERERLFERAYLNKHMTCAFRMKEQFTKDLPSAVHIDATARVQFVEESDNPAYYRLLRRVKERTGYGVIINTSFNRHGRTIVECPDDAIDDFLDTDLGFLMIEGYLVTRA